MSFGEKLKDLRTGAGWTQTQLAEASGVPVGTIRDYEQGKRDPLLSSAQKLARALGKSLDVFPVADGVAVESKPAGQRRPAPKKGKGRK